MFSFNFYKRIIFFIFFTTFPIPSSNHTNDIVLKRKNDKKTNLVSYIKKKKIKIFKHFILLKK